MNTIYIVDGQEYSVGSSKLEQFFEKFPNAVKKGKEQGLTVDPTMGQDDMGSQLDDGSLVSQEELSDSQQFSNVFKNAKLGLQEAWESTKIAGAQFSSYLGAGDEEETDKYIVDQYKKLDEISAKMGDTGKGIVKGVKEGDFADVGIGVVNALTSVITTVAPAMLTRGASLVPQIMAPMYTEYNSEKAKALYGDDEERAIEKLIENNEDEVAIPMALGAASVALEKIGIKGISKYVLNNAKTKGARRIADLTLTGNREGLTEYFQGGLNVANKSLAQGDNAETVSKKVFDHMSSEDALEEYVQGFVGGAGMSAGGRKINSAFRDKNDNKIVNDYVNAIGALNQQKVSSKTEDAKNAIDKKIKQTEQSFKNFLIQNKKRSEYLTEDQATEAINILDTKKELNVKLQNINNQLKNNEINKNEHSIILEDINNQFETNNKKLNDIKVEANKKLLHDDLRISNEAISKIKGLSQNIYKTPEDFLKALNAKSKKQYTLEEIQSVDGLVVGKEILINETIAAENNAVTVGSHELLHAIVKSSITGKTRKVKDVDGNTVETDLTEDGAILIKDFLNELNSKENKIVQERIDTNYRYNRNKKGEIVSEKAFEQYAEEYLNAYADAAIKNELSDSVLEKLGKFLQKIFNNGDNGYKDLSFKTGKDVKTFLKSYVSDRKKGSFRQQFVDMAQEGAGKETTIIKKSLTKKGLNTQQVTDKVNKLGRIDSDGNNLQEKGIGNFLWEAESDAIVKEIKEEGYIDNLIAKQYKVEDVPVNFVNDVITQLIPDIKGFKPEQNDSFFAYLNSRIKFRAGDVYNKLYKGDEAIKGAKDIGKTTKEGEVKVQVAAETDTAMEALETEDLSPAARAKKKADKAKGKEKVESKFRKQLGIETGGKLYNKVLDSAKKALLRAYEAGTSVRNIQRKLRDEANVYLFKEIKNLLGTKKYISNLKEFRIPIIEAIFTADLIQIERNVPENKRVFTKFVKKLTSKAEVQTAVDQNLLPASALNIIDKGTAVSLYEKVMPTEKQFVSFFDQPLKIPALDKKGNQMMKDGFSLMIRSGLKGTRKDALTKAMAGALSYDATMQVAQEQDVIEKREQLAALKGETLAEDNLETLAAAIGRDPNVKFSKSNENRIVSNMAGEILSLVNEMSTDPSLITFENGVYKINQNVIKQWTRKAKFKKSDEAIIAEFAYKMYRGNTYGKLTNFELAKKVLKDVIKARKNKYDLKVNQAFEQLVISSLQYAVKNINSRLKTNKKVKEGVGQGDAYISFNRNILGIEVKMNEADGVSQTVNIKVDGDGRYSLTYANPNPTTNDSGKKFDELIGDKILDATKQLNSDLKKAGLGPIAENTKLTEAQIKFIEDNVLKTHFLQHMEISPEYAMWHYGNAKYQNKPQGFIQVGESLYRMITGNSKIDNLSLAIQQEYKGIIPNLSTNEKSTMEMVARLKIDNGKLKWRISPRIMDTQLAESKVNLLSSKDAGAFVKAADKVMVSFSKSQDAQTLGKAVKLSRSANNPTKGITVLDFDDTLATTKSLVKFTRPDGTTGTLNAEQYASTYENLLDQGYTFDFSEFNKVVKGKLAPLFQKALKLQGKFGPENMFVLTARPPQAAKAIFDFLKANGLNIPIKNITGLGNSTAEAKALWIADKVGDGFNDFYFADDALQNVQAVKNMLDQFDVKSKVQQAKVKFSKNMNNDFNKILEEVAGIDAVKRFSAIKGRKRGESKGKFRLFIPPSHEDFVGLLYNFMGKGRKGDQHRNFFEQALIRPLNRAYREIDTAKQAIANDYKNLGKRFPKAAKALLKKTKDGDFTFQDAVRVYLWNKHGYKIQGLSPTDQQKLVDLVNSMPGLKSYAENVNIISKQEKYVDPGPNWETGNIRIDLIDATGRVGRAQYFTEFNENAETIFSPENLNKIEAAYGKDFREALEDMLHRIKTGVNRPKGASAKPNMFMNWLNASVSGVMFFNTRSALLQQMSNVNFLNFADNNIYAAGKAFADQPQYWKDFAMIFNSDMLKQRRGGLQTDINGAELAEAIKKARPDNVFDQVAIITGKALRLGFLPTQIGDNIAIATGGAAFYRNRVNKYIKDGMSVKEAEAAAFTDFQNITQSTQQSARPDMTSQQQASWIGKLVLNFLNTPSQYNRIIKKAGSDIINRRITPPNTTQMQSDMSNMSRILYYGAAQNLIFYGLQTALFAVMFGDDEEDNEAFLKKKERVINGSIDTILRGSGIYGVAVSTLKNMIIKFAEQREKGYNKDESAVIMELANFSPVVGIKLRKIVNAEKTLNYNKKVIDEMETFDIDNPQWSAVTNYVEAITTAPTNRIYQKTINLRNASDNQYTAFQRALFFSGYTTWSLNLGDTEKMKDIKESVKGKKKTNTRSRTRTRTRSRTRAR